MNQSHPTNSTCSRSCTEYANKIRLIGFVGVCSWCTLFIDAHHSLFRYDRFLQHVRQPLDPGLDLVRVGVREVKPHGILAAPQRKK